MASQSVSFALYSRCYLDCVQHLEPRDGPFGNGYPGSAADIKHVQATALIKAIVKKFEDEIDPAIPDSVALQKFLAANERCRNWQLPERVFVGEGAKREEVFSSAYTSELLGEFRKILNGFFRNAGSEFQREKYLEFDWDNLLDWSKIEYFADNGPGASIGASGDSWIEKFSMSPLTYGREFLWSLFDSYTRRNPNRAVVEQLRDMRFGHVLSPTCNFATVPKNVTESRSICVEPALNMWYQKGVQSLMVSQLVKCFGLDLQNQQELNRELARLGSIDGRFGTIDLTSASDTIAWNMLKWALDRDVFGILNAIRSPTVTLPDGAVVDLHMMSTMGNAYTFPLQTAIFAAVVLAVYNCMGIPTVRPGRVVNREVDGKLRAIRTLGNYAVNGDDIIVVREAYDTVLYVLDLLGFIPNKTKSFNEGYFRESCGGDYYRGHGVRGVYCKTLKTKQDHASLINRLNRWSSETGIPLTNTVQWLLGRIKQPLWIPYHESDDAGIKIPLSFIAPVKKRSFGKPRQVDYQSGHTHYVSWRVVPYSLKVGSDEWVFGPAATYYSALKGELRGERLTPRQRDTTYRDVRATTHRWDSDEVGHVLSEDELSSWIWAVWKNLGRTRFNTA